LSPARVCARTPLLLHGAGGCLHQRQARRRPRLQARLQPRHGCRRAAAPAVPKINQARNHLRIAAVHLLVQGDQPKAL
jgi:hypothetical protein